GTTFRTSVRPRSKPPFKEIRNECVHRLVCFQSVVRKPCSGAGLGRDRPAMAPAHDLVVRSVSAGATLHARPRSKVASEACGRRRVGNLGAAQTISLASQSRNASKGATPMTATQYAANMARTFMAAELAMASVNCGAPIVTRAQAERLLDEYFAPARAP